MGIFVWAVKSQGIESSAKCFCRMQELLYETKPWGKNSIITTSVVMGLLPIPMPVTLCDVLEEMARELDGRMVLCEE
jgi:hypothetical protein